MVYPNSKTMGKMAIEALQLSGQRGILARGWGGLQIESNMLDNIFVVDEVPHDWLFPQMKAVVHHGGAGTTAAILRAGVPALTIPFMQDQPYWAQRLRQLGVSPDPIPYKKLNVKNFAERLSLVSQDVTFQNQARHIGTQIRLEQGVECAVSNIEAYFNQLG
jgi:sterol 3beta-glucosyltransferase